MLAGTQRAFASVSDPHVVVCAISLMTVLILSAWNGYRGRESVVLDARYDSKSAHTCSTSCCDRTFDEGFSDSVWEVISRRTLLQSGLIALGSNA